MGIDITSYRIRIGKLGPGNVRTLHERINLYNPFSNGPDVHYSMFATMVVMWTLLSSCQFALECQNSFDRGYLIGDILCGDIHFKHQAMCYDFSGTTSLPPNVNERLPELSLLLSFDVETNPGPTQFDDILQAIKSSENKVLGEVRSMKADIVDIKNDLSTLKIENDQIKMNMTQLQIRQSSLADIVTDTNANIDELNEVTENHRLDIEHINTLAEQNCSDLEKLEIDIERLNTAQISANMRIFGLDVKLGDSENCAKQKVLKHVLNKACPDYDWVPEDIKRVQVIASSDGEKFPLVIVHFRFDDDKFKIYRGREELRTYGLRVGDDLTYRQR